MYNQNTERGPTSLNPVSELYHYGIKNMKWGLQRFQLGDGTWTPEGLARRREREGFGSDEDRTQNGRHTKEEIINSGNVKLVGKYRSELTTDELRTAINRIDTEKRLDSLLKDANKSLWMKRAERAAKLANVTAKTFDSVVTWSTKGNGKVLIDMLSGKTERDALVTKKIREGDLDWLDKNFNSMSVSQQKAAVDAMGNREKFKTRNWDGKKEDSGNKKSESSRQSEGWELDPKDKDDPRRWLL